MDALALQLLLGRAPDLSAQRLRAALERIGVEPRGPQALAALCGERTALLRSLGLPPAASAWLHAPDEALIEADRAWITRERIGLLDALSAPYPPLLAQIPAAPALLYVQGELATLSSEQLAIVGARRPSRPARLLAVQFARALAERGLTITSGLALGIDSAGHEGALAAGGRTIAVLGAGLDRIYPRQHRSLAERIAAHGALVSEFPRGTPPLRSNFPRRNRIISGLCRGTLVVEAAPQSGSLITAQFAADQGREVFAIPGSIQNPLTRGCHSLIRSGATLVESPQDIFDEIGICDIEQSDRRRVALPQNPAVRAATLDKGHKILLDAMGFEPASVDALVQRTGLPSQAVASMLLILELEGAIGPHDGGRYVRL
jgi:DNA processing protein